jgi:aspartyl-tRNA(Asn)/glutamyl-tRNA(Gln) amidotransferase subunit A
MESMTYDFDQYIRRMGPDAIAHNIAELVALLPPESIESGFPARLAADPTAPDMTEFIALREAYLDAFAEAMAVNDLDALVFPVDANGVPELGGPGRVTITVPEINISGLPGVVVPAGQYADGSPFALIFIGPMWSEAELLSYAYDYEQATNHRIEPELMVVD